MAIAFVPDFALGRDNLSSSSGYVVKVIINKSCGEVSPIEQDTVDCEYLAYFSPKKNQNKILSMRTLKKTP